MCRREGRRLLLSASHSAREITPLAGYEPFFGTDFTYQDLSFVRFHGHEKLDGTEMHGGVKAYKLEETLANNPYYSKVTTWVATDTGLPIERDYYDVDGKLFKSENFEKISMVDNVPAVMKIAMNEVQSGGSSDIDVSSVECDKQAATRLFNPKDLPGTANDAFWKGIAQ
ncbi:MAG: outer membrane lipoprotein-sorting protein [Candidatus Binataceae bacterium]